MFELAFRTVRHPRRFIVNGFRKQQWGVPFGFRHYNDARTSGYGRLSHTKEMCLYAGVDSLMLVCQSKRQRVGVRNVGVCVLVCMLVCM